MAVRTSEAKGATFDEFDPDAKVWIIPERMKAPRGSIECRWQPRAVAIVREMATAQRIRVPGRKRGEPLSDVAMWMTLRDMHPSITVHGFRSSFRDWAGEETNTPRDVCEAALAHPRKDKVHAAYPRGDLFKKRDTLMQYCEPPIAANRRAARTLTSAASCTKHPWNTRA
jgi:integrase